MRKIRKFLILLSVCMAAMFLPCLTGCDDSDADQNITALGDLPREKVIEIRDACFEQFYGDELFAEWKYDKIGLSVSQYYGTFGDDIVVGIADRADKNVGWDCAFHNLIIDEVLVVRDYSMPYGVYVYDDTGASGKALTLLKDAYEAGRIDRDELGRIALVERELKEKAYREYGYDIGQSYVSDMTEEQTKAVRTDYLHAFYPEAEEDRVVHISIVDQLYTCADGSLVFCVREDYIGLRLGVAAKGEVSLVAGGREICVFPNEQYRIFVYTSDKECLSLQIAYAAHVSEEELEEISLQAREGVKYYPSF